MRYLLDTNVCVMCLNGRSVLVRDRLHSTLIEERLYVQLSKPSYLTVQCGATIQNERWIGNRDFC